MSTINVQQQISENKRKLGVIGLLALPIVAAWGLAVKMALKLRK
jgi:hypothetical protein